MVDTGAFAPWGTRAFAAASMATNDSVYGHRGVIYKQQYNARIYQPIGSNGDFISVAGHYNQNRNNFFRNPCFTDLRTPRCRTAGWPDRPRPRPPPIAGHGRRF